MQKLYKLSKFEMKKSDDEKATISGIFSTADKDRHGDIVKQSFDLKFFKSNPVILDSHNYHEATAVIGKATKIGVKNGELTGQIEFAVNENPKAKVVYDLYKGGFLNAFSIGFMPKSFTDEGHIEKSELLEISAVSVPANAMALAKAKGINVEKLYEPITKDIKDEGIDEEENPPEGDGGEDDGTKNPEINEDSPKEPIEEPVDEPVEKSEKKNGKAQTLKKMACIIDAICESGKGRNSVKSEKAEVNKHINRAIRKLLTMKE